jgi:hypothetical protein
VAHVREEVVLGAVGRLGGFARTRELVFDLFELGDVGFGAGKVRDLARVVEHERPTREPPAHRPIAMQDTVLDVPVWRPGLQGRLELCDEPGAIIRMDRQRQQLIEPSGHAGGVEAQRLPQVEERPARAFELALRKIRGIDCRAGTPHRELDARLGLLKRHLERLALGDVLQNSQHVHRPTAGVALNDRDADVAPDDRAILP